MNDYDVIVAGAGLGGLCAASGLQRAGFRVLVLERDADLASRPQGYRININLAGDAALQACLSESHFALYRDTSHRQIDASVDIYGTDLRPLLHRTGEVRASGPAPAAVDRGILRALLLHAAKDVRFGCEVVDAISYADGVAVHLGDGGMMRAGLLVAADGATSTLRRCLLPGHDPEPLRIIGVYGRAALDTSALTWLPRGVVEQRFVGVTDSAGTTLALGAWYPRRIPAEAARERLPGCQLPMTAPYVMWVLLCPAEAAPGADAIPEAHPEALHRFALEAVSGWSPAATRFVQNAIVPDTFRVTLRAMTAVPSWNLGRITFLGDAIHAMSPAGGEGANTAFADAASLVSCLKSHGFDRLAAYENDLRLRAHAALERSANYENNNAQEVPDHV
jgi:2-polyprenyl-6-methoxyphenol hydroxylase-like FAD-dependent oxidoreductase